jgi:hypothetical protein
MTRWRSTAERRQGRGSSSSLLPALRRRRMTTTMIRGWRSVTASASRSGLGPCQPRRALLAVQPLPCRGRHRPCPGRGRQPSLPPSLPRRKRQRSWRGKLLPFPWKPSSSLRVRRRGPLSSHPLVGTWRRGRSLPPCRRPRAHSGPSYCSVLGPRAECCRRGDHCPAYIGGGAAGP